MRTFVLTGVGKGLGKALHDLLLGDDFRSDQKIFISHSLPDGEQPELNARYLSLDFQQPRVERITDAIANTTRSIVFLNNAGTIHPVCRATDLGAGDLQANVGINLFTPVEIASALTRFSADHGARLQVFNISSGAANRPIKGWLAYCVAKAGVKMAFDVLSEENAHVETVHFDPGVMDTDMQAYIRERPEQAMPDVSVFREFERSNKLKMPADVADAIIERIQGWKG